MRTLKTAAKLALVMTAVLAMAAQAAPKPPGRAPVLQSVVDCRKLTDDAARLACYDAATAKLDDAEKAGDVVVVDKAQVREARKAAFGFNFQMPAFMTAGEKPEELERITAVVASARQEGMSGKWVIKLEDGAVWRQIDTVVLTRDPKKGSKAEIRTAALGSYFMKIDNNPQMRVHRDN
ncbi:hypothetical protein QO010_001229 [Caulobacter ginsengisoli]|uniref:Uncharacterized protein n=1 Tax=Caulobacter ginsengisoli TaxID=400775 RepID=A0ABU0IN72_9CAUL|nr:hypothetical protein [Caulobacter ginsengisoli]MDQ0463458.1 hypothetical protein [Caulobacter ginsengisoli]